MYPLSDNISLNHKTMELTVINTPEINNINALKKICKDNTRLSASIPKDILTLKGHGEGDTM